MTASELAKTYDVPESTTYRKLDLLGDASVVEEQLEIRPDGRRTTRYALNFDEVRVSLDDDRSIDVAIKRQSRAPEERLSDRWSEVRGKHESEYHDGRRRPQNGHAPARRIDHLGERSDTTPVDAIDVREHVRTEMDNRGIPPVSMGTTQTRIDTSKEPPVSVSFRRSVVGLGSRPTEQTHPCLRIVRQHPPSRTTHSHPPTPDRLGFRGEVPIESTIRWTGPPYGTDLFEPDPESGPVDFYRTDGTEVRR